MGGDIGAGVRLPEQGALKWLYLCVCVCVCVNVTRVLLELLTLSKLIVHIYP